LSQNTVFNDEIFRVAHILSSKKVDSYRAAHRWPARANPAAADVRLFGTVMPVKAAAAAKGMCSIVKNIITKNDYRVNKRAQKLFPAAC
ncbi:MAG: hypothetical protein PUB63_01100, partial [Clostridia bacterium]|nr:hypothetical protein [Clostridia bacterium]